MLSSTCHPGNRHHWILAAFATTLIWASVLPASASDPQQPQVDLFLKRPYLIYPGDPTRMQVLWQLTATEGATVQWGVDETYSAGSAQTQEYGDDHQHTLTITGLTPGQHYSYRVTVQDVSYGGSFNAAPSPSSTRVKFLAYGDARSNPETHNQVMAGILAAWDADPAYQSLVLVTGDLASSGDSEDAWTEELFDPAYTHIQQGLARIPYQACMGNHEGSGELFVKYLPYPFVGGRYWSYDYGPAHFVVVDQYTSYDAGSAQLDWIASDLAATTKPWKFLVLHEPGWSAGGGHSNNSTVQDDLQPLCLQYGVSIVFGGHNHYYARAVVDDVVHITTGGGGAPLHTPGDAEPNVVTAAEVNHYCAIDIDGDWLRLRAFRTDGALIDSFSVHRPTPVTLSDITTAAGKDYVELRWTASLEGPATLQVLRSPQADGDYVPVSEELQGTPGRQDFVWRDVNVNAATEYYYRIRWRETLDWHESASIRVMTAAGTFGIRRITPSPFGQGTSRIDFELVHGGRARLEIFDAAGKYRSTLLDDDLAPGTRAVTWNGRDRDGLPLPAGVYFAKLSSLGAASTHKVVLVR